jgi:hypothetical protein
MPYGCGLYDTVRSDIDKIGNLDWIERKGSGEVSVSFDLVCHADSPLVDLTRRPDYAAFANAAVPPHGDDHMLTRCGAPEVTPEDRS